MQSKVLQKKIILFTTLPVVIAGLLLALTYMGAQTLRAWESHKDFVRLAHKLYIKPTDTRSANTSHTLTLGEFEHISTALLQSESILSAELYDELTLVANFGLPTYDSTLAYLSANKPQWYYNNKYFHVISIAGAPTQKIVISTSSWLNQNHYRDLLFLLLATVMLTATTSMLALKLRDYVEAPLSTLHNGLQRLINGKYKNPIRTENLGIYKQLTRDINKLATVQKNAYEDAQRSIEQATSELEETLETVEIQNIEIDLARKNAVIANQQKSEFLANTSHEIRTPLNGIIGFTELLKSTELSRQQTEYLSTIEESAKSLLISINDIIDYSRLEVGKLSLDFKPVFIRQTVEEALQYSASLADEKNLRLISIVDKKIPKQLLGDPLRIKQVLTNLISNAISFATRGNIQINVSMEARKDEEVTLKFKVTDIKTGLSKPQQEEMSQLLEATNVGDVHAMDKNDMGLLIAKGLTDRMNGSIGIIYRELNGVTFWFTASLGRSHYENIPNITSQALTHIHAVIYDTDPAGRMEVDHLVSSWGAKTSVTDQLDNIESLARNIQNSPNNPVVIIDTEISEKTFTKDALEALIANLSQSPSIPVVAIVSPRNQHVLAPLLPAHLCLTVQRPIMSKIFFDLLCKQLGVVKNRLSVADSFFDNAHQKPSTKSINVLVVDDNPSNLKLVGELLKDLRVEVSKASSGEEAITLFKKNPYSVIFMDVQMPSMDGFETTKKIRQLEADSNTRTPIIALTAHAVEEEKAKLLLAGMDDFASKPIREEELVELMKRWAKQPLEFEKSTPESTQPQENQQNSMAALDAKNEQKVEPVDIKLSLELAKNKPDLAKDMLTMLINTLPSERKNMEKEFQTQNWGALQEVVHKLHGGCCYCGVPALKNATSTLDKSLKDNLLTEVEQEYNSVIKNIDAILQWSKSNDIEQTFQ